MKTFNDGGMAFPLAEETEGGRLVGSSYGLSMLDYFAIHTDTVVDPEAPASSFEDLMGSSCPDADHDPEGFYAWWDAVDAKRRYMRARAMVDERERLQSEAYAPTPTPATPSTEDDLPF